jgi:hypothetical protein
MNEDGFMVGFRRNSEFLQRQRTGRPEQDAVYAEGFGEETIEPVEDIENHELHRNTLRSVDGYVDHITTLFESSNWNDEYIATLAAKNLVPTIIIGDDGALSLETEGFLNLLAEEFKRRSESRRMVGEALSGTANFIFSAKNGGQDECIWERCFPATVTEDSKDAKIIQTSCRWLASELVAKALFKQGYSYKINIPENSSPDGFDHSGDNNALPMTRDGQEVDAQVLSAPLVEPIRQAMIEAIKARVKSKEGRLIGV